MISSSCHGCGAIKGPHCLRLKNRKHGYTEKSWVLCRRCAYFFTQIKCQSHFFSTMQKIYDHLSTPKTLPLQITMKKNSTLLGCLDPIERSGWVYGYALCKTCRNRRDREDRTKTPLPGRLKVIPGRDCIDCKQHLSHEIATLVDGTSAECHSFQCAQPQASGPTKFCISCLHVRESSAAGAPLSCLMSPCVHPISRNRVCVTCHQLRNCSEYKRLTSDTCNVCLQTQSLQRKKNLHSTK